MAQHERKDALSAQYPALPAAAGHRPGGEVGRMQADLAHRLAREGIVWGSADVAWNEQPGERLVRFVSTASGFLALMTAYAGVAFLILR